MGFTRIKDSDLTGKQVSELSDIPELTASELKQRFDSVSKDVIIPKFNNLVTELEAENGSKNIGLSVPEGIEADPNISAVVAAMARELKENTKAMHGHENKTVLDGITATVKAGYDKLVTLFKNITSVSDAITDSSSVLPTGKAIVSYVKTLGSGDMQAATYDKDGNGVVDNSEKLGGVEADKYQKTTDETLETTNKTIPGAINELYNRKVDVVDPAEATEEGQAADALKTHQAIEECFQYASDGKQMIADAITSVGVEVTSEESFASLANLITTKLLYVPKSQELTSEFAYTSYKEVGSSLWTIPFDSITENDIISVAAGAFSCKVDIKRLTIAATVYMGCGSQGSCRVNLYTDGAVLHYNGGSAAQGAKSMSYVWENIPAGTAFNIKTSSYQPNGNTTFKSAVLSLAVELE